MRIGFGYDVHRFVEGRDLIIGGEKIDYPKGLLGHSDADVLVHAIMDAILGAMGLGDIGKQFPDTDPAYEDISSLDLLERVYGLMDANSYQIGNIDATVNLEEPKIGQASAKMVSNISDILNTDPKNISIKATTSEGLGFVGEKKGASAYAVVLLKEK